jgi:hypothetical protein
MQGRLIAGVAAIAGCVVAACWLIPSIGSGATDRRGGDHGCNASEGTYFEDGFWAGGDEVVFGFHTRPASFPNPDLDGIASTNTSSANQGDSTGTSCSADTGTWREISSRLGADDDTVRLDGKGLEEEVGEPPYRAIPNTIDAILKTGSGNDTIRGHRGFDKIRASRGDDVVKVDDGKKDIVKCGPGDDKADLDSKDKPSGCEKKT